MDLALCFGMVHILKSAFGGLLLPVLLTMFPTNNVSTVVLFSFCEGGRGVCTCGVGFGFGGGWGVQSGQPFAPLDIDIMHFFGITTSKLNSGGHASICLTNATIYFDTEVTLMFVRMKLMKVTLFGRMLSNQSLKDYVKCNSL